MLTRAVPSTGEQIPVVGIGSWIQFDTDDTSEIRQLETVLRTLYSRSGRVIDSSPMYGKAEKAIGDITSRMQEQNDFFYATKVWTTGRESGLRQIAASFSKMRREKMDLVQVHNLVDLPTHMHTLREYKSQGKVRYTGVTHYLAGSHPALEKAIRDEKPDFVQFNYSITERNAERSLLNTAADAGVAVIINEPLDKGAVYRHVRNKPLPPWAVENGMASWTAFFLKYIISHPSVTCVIPGTSDPAHAAENASAGEGPLPDDAMRKRMVQFIASL